MPYLAEKRVAPLCECLLLHVDPLQLQGSYATLLEVFHLIIIVLFV